MLPIDPSGNFGRPKRQNFSTQETHTRSLLKCAPNLAEVAGR